jgi:hypothetical protein
MMQVHVLLQGLDATRQQLAALASPDSRRGQPVGLNSQYVNAATLPSGTEAAAVLATLASTAQQLGLGLADISSTIEREPSHPRLRQSFEFQVQGNFKAIGGLTAELLKQHQTLALDSINAERVDDDSPIVTASLRLSLFIEP